MTTKTPRPLVTTELEMRLYRALARISSYQSIASLRRYAERDYGVRAEEAIEMAYENVVEEAKRAIKGVRLPNEQKARR